MSTTETHERVLSRSVIGGRVRESRARFATNERPAVPLLHAPEERGPHYSDAARAPFAESGLIPLSEISYWLLWGNQFRQNEGESHFDRPTADALRGFLGVIESWYSPTDSSTESDFQPEVAVVPYFDFAAFLETVASADRQELLLALDAFVGAYQADT